MADPMRSSRAAASSCRCSRPHSLAQWRARRRALHACAQRAIGRGDRHARARPRRRSRTDDRDRADRARRSRAQRVELRRARRGLDRRRSVRVLRRRARRASRARATAPRPKHSRATPTTSARPSAPRASSRELRTRGEAPPGFGHQLYPDGDPRPTPLLGRRTRLDPQTRAHDPRDRGCGGRREETARAVSHRRSSGLPRSSPRSDSHRRGGLGAVRRRAQRRLARARARATRRGLPVAAARSLHRRALRLDAVRARPDRTRPSTPAIRAARASAPCPAHATYTFGRNRK